MAAKSRGKRKPKARKGSARATRRSRPRSLAKQRSRLPMAMVLTALAVLVTLAVMLGYVRQQEQIKIKGYKIRRLSQRGSELVEEIKNLKKEVARLEAAGRIERIATEQLHMQELERWQTIPVYMATLPGYRAGDRVEAAVPAR